MEIRWESEPNKSLRVRYFVDSVFVGEGSDGFNDVLRKIRTSKSASVTLKLKGTLSHGGGNLEDLLPFKEALEEFKAALGTKRIIYEMF